MDSYELLERATALLGSTIRNFSIGAVTLSDFKPIEEKIRDLRGMIKCLTARIQLLQAINEARAIPAVSPAQPKELEKKMHEILSSNHLIKYDVFKNTLHSHAAESLLSNDQISPEMKRLKAVMAKLYSQNDKIIVLQEEMDRLRTKERTLQAEVAASIIDFQNFLKEQEKVRNEKLALSNPDIARKKQKLKKMITKINISRRIITSIISAASTTITDNPEMLRMLKDHRDIVDEETIMEMANNREAQQESPS
ncbi:uncharacterized protein LOC107048158 isoform X2 [Diachasma alloeum]|uniref:uncharacterized protein LOC107048158 isoform X2 n=1 Tax=Diachasma alloeum TaxID=454923 RepID=UPI000738512F|nr:uncharacterized protein LOC107048158 isoform X2 [Diachasma alloeum]